MLGAMLDYQSKFMDAEIKRLHPNGFDMTTMHHSLCSHMISECQELMDCQPWYFHKKPQASTQYTTLTELVDVWKWMLNLMFVHGFSAQEFLQVFCEKSTVVESRIRAETLARSKPGPMLILDIDGVLCDRDTPLMALAHKQFGTGVQGCKTPKEVKAAMGAKHYAALKTLFYQSDHFDRCLPNTGAIQALNEHKGIAPVLLLTARQVKKHARLHFQTIKWLHENGVQYDGLVCMEEKGKALESWCDPESVFLDDDQSNVDDVAPVCNSILYKDPIQIVQSLERVRQRSADRGPR